MVLQLNETARWYYGSKKTENEYAKVQGKFNFSRMVYLYGLGLFGPADALRNKLLATYTEESVDAELRKLLKEEYCQISSSEEGANKTSDGAEKAKDIPLPPVCGRINEMFQ